MQRQGRPGLVERLQRRQYSWFTAQNSQAGFGETVSMIIPGGHNVAGDLIAFLPYPIPVILGESCQNGDLLKEKHSVPFTDLPREQCVGSRRRQAKGRRSQAWRFC